MVRISKQSEKRARCPKRPSPPSVKTGAKKDNLQKGFKEHENALQGDLTAAVAFIPKIR